MGVNNVINPSQEGFILFNYSNVMKSLSQDQILLTLTFDFYKKR